MSQLLHLYLHPHVSGSVSQHVDGNNEGPSQILGFGDNTGGEVWIYDKEKGDVEMETKETEIRIGVPTSTKFSRTEVLGSASSTDSGKGASRRCGWGRGWGEDVFYGAFL